MKQLYNFTKQLWGIKALLKPSVYLPLFTMLFFLIAAKDARAQELNISGTVSDSLGVKIKGVNVTAVGNKKIHTVTDDLGAFVLTAPDGTELNLSL
jgi:hypothetical protein